MSQPMVGPSHFEWFVRGDDVEGVAGGGGEPRNGKVSRQDVFFFFLFFPGEGIHTVYESNRFTSPVPRIEVAVAGCERGRRRVTKHDTKIFNRTSFEPKIQGTAARKC